MTFTRHGHHIPGTDERILLKDESEPPKSSSCKGLELCDVCKNDVAAAHEFVCCKKAEVLVREYVDAHLELNPENLIYEVYSISFDMVHRGSRVLLSTTVLDRMYYEVTYLCDDPTVHLDAYKKIERPKNLS